MKLVSKAVFANLFFLTALPLAADDLSNQLNQNNPPPDNNSQTLVQYLQNLGAFLGYDLTQKRTSSTPPISQELLNASSKDDLTQFTNNYLYVFESFLGAIPVNPVSQALSQFVPSLVTSANIINPLANATFNYQQYNNSPSACPSPPAPGQLAKVAPTSGQNGLTVNCLIDQPTFQQDPVSQLVLNILGTPDYSYCMQYGSNTWNDSCPLLYQNQVMANVIGPIPKTYDYYTYAYNQPIIGQLNSNSLMGPLMYTTYVSDQDTESQQASAANQGLVAKNQVQEAGNFIRYASGAVAPGSLPQLAAYDHLYTQASADPANSNTTLAQKMQAQATLNTYFTNLRIFAAQSSVGIGNLYYILSKRLPQNLSKQGTPILTSQAMTEFKMATWRLYNPDLSSNPQWVTKLNDASSATVQKEIATLLAEINYQMYLGRQLQERLLLTNSILLIQSTKISRPNATLQDQSTQ